jgi:hypothetical protein
MGGPGLPTCPPRPRYRLAALLLTLAMSNACAMGQPTTGPTTGPTSGPTDRVRPTSSPPVSLPPTTMPSLPPAASLTLPPAATASPAAAAEWHQRTLGGPAPSAREDQTWTIDGAGRFAYLFGGRAGADVSDELWRYDLRADAWQQLDPAGPAPAARFGHVAVWLADDGLAIWSGQGESRFFDDLWLYDPRLDAWRELPAGGALPEARYGSCGGVAPDGRLWISHGFTRDDGRFADTRAYDFTTGEWSDVTPSGERPVERCLHDCLWTPAGELLLYGGQTTGVAALGDAWLYDPATGSWAEQLPPPAEARQLYALASLGETAWIYGGGTLDGGYLADLWQIDLATPAWQQVEAVGPSPSARSSATLIADPAGRRLLLFGGTNEDGAQGDLWQFELATD